MTRPVVAFGLLAMIAGCSKRGSEGTGNPDVDAVNASTGGNAPLSRGPERNAPLSRGPERNAPLSRGPERNAPLSRGPERNAPLSRVIDPKITELPTYVVMPLGNGEQLTVDGRLDEPAWQRTPETRAFVNPGNGQPPPPNSPLGGTARLRYDARALYIAIEATDQELRGNFDPKTTDPHLWTQDTVEVMLDPEGDGDNRDYYEIQVNPQGLVFDSQFDDYNQPRTLPDGPFGHQDWQSGLERAVVLRGTLEPLSDRDEGYVVEMALPFASLKKVRQLPPGPGSEWRANFYVMQNNGGVSWSPILGQGNFHKASRFGRLRFGP